MVKGAAAALQAPKEYAAEYLLGVVEADVGSWSGLDESGPDKVGVGLFFKIDRADGSVRVVSLVPGSAAHCSGLVIVGDKLTAVDNESIYGLTLIELRDRVHGMPGSFISLDFERDENGGKRKYRVNVMRGSPQFVAYKDRFGMANASRLDELILQKREEQKFNAMVEKQLRIEQARFAKAQARRKDMEDNEAQLRHNLEQAQKELYEEEQKLEFAKETLRNAEAEEEEEEQPAPMLPLSIDKLADSLHVHDLTKALSLW